MLKNVNEKSFRFYVYEREDEWNKLNKATVWNRHAKFADWVSLDNQLVGEGHQNRASAECGTLSQPASIHTVPKL